MSNQNQNRQHGNRSNNDRGNRGNKARVFSKGEQMEIVFAEKDFPSGRRKVSYVTDESGSIIVYPKSKRFQPIPGKAYQCSVMFKENSRGKFGLALPSTPFTLTPKEWLPVEELRSCLVVSLVFQQKAGREGQDKRLIAFNEGRAVFPDNGTTVVAGKLTQCLLREAGNVAFAIPVGVEQQTGKGLMLLGEKLGEVLREDLLHVVVRCARKKAGVHIVKSDGDIEVSGEYRSIYEILSNKDANAVVTESSTEDEINKAYRRITLVLHPDKVAQDFGGADKLPLLVKKNAEFFFEALGTAKERAIDLIARKKGGSAEKRTDAAKVQADAPKGDKPGKRDRRDRRNEGRGQAEAPKADAAPAAPAPEATETAAPVAAIEEAPKAEEQVKVEAPVAETLPAPAEPQADGETSDEGVDPMVAGLANELREPVEVILAALEIAKMTPEEFVGKGENIQKFYLKQARGRVKSAKAATAGSKGSSSKKAEAKGSAPKGDFRQQLAAKASEDKQ